MSRKNQHKQKPGKAPSLQQARPFVEGALASLARTKARGDAIPAEKVMAKLEDKLRRARGDVAHGPGRALTARDCGYCRLAL